MNVFISFQKLKIFFQTTLFELHSMQFVYILVLKKSCKIIKFDTFQCVYFLFHGCVDDIIVIGTENRIGNLSSNFGLDCLHLLCANAPGKGLYSSHLPTQFIDKIVG